MPKIIYEANLNSEKICSISIAAWVKFGYFKMNGCIPKIATHCNQVSLYFHSRAICFNWSYPIHTPAVISIKISQENRGSTVHPQCDAPELAKLVSNWANCEPNLLAWFTKWLRCHGSSPAMSVLETVQDAWQMGSESSRPVAGYLFGAQHMPKWRMCLVLHCFCEVVDQQIILGTFLLRLF